MFLAAMLASVSNGAIQPPAITFPVTHTPADSDSFSVTHAVRSVTALRFHMWTSSTAGVVEKRTESGTIVLTRNSYTTGSGSSTFDGSDSLAGFSAMATNL